MDPLGWLRASGNLLQMRMKNPSRFKEILVEADIYGRPEAAKISFAGRIATFGHAGAQVALEACEINIIEIFFEESYKQFNANGKRVIDVGCAGGDTAIYFLLHGASSVTGYDISP